MKRHLEKLRAARNAKCARHDYDYDATASSSSTGSVASGMVGFWGGAIPLCWGCDGLTSGGPPKEP